MNIISSLLRFIYRLRYWLLIGPAIATALAIYFTSNLPKTYEANTTIFTGIMSNPDMGSQKNTDWNSTNNAFDNIINLVHSRSTMERVSIRLFAQAMMKGDPKKDNLFIKAESYNNLMRIVPDDVKKLIDKNDEQQTVQNLLNYKKEDSNNFLYGLQNWFYPYYSFNALSAIGVSRLGSSDMLDIRYSCGDPGIAHQTLIFLNEEIISEYTNLQLGPSNSVIDYFENQLKLIQDQLNVREDSLTVYSIQGKIINYEEQTKQLTQISTDISNKYEQALMDFYSSRKLINNLEAQLSARTNLVKENRQFMRTLDEVALLTKKITEIEAFSDEGSTEQANLPRYKLLLEKTEQKLYDITDKISEVQYSKEGISMDNIVTQWLGYILQNEKAKAEIGALKDRKKSIDAEFLRFTPIGPNLKKQERDIALAEESYHTILTHLAQAKLQQKNIQMISATLKVIAPPIYPLAAAGTKRKVMVIAAFFGCIAFILGFFILFELLDRTVRDKNRATRFTKAKVLGAFPGNLSLSHRGYAKENNRIASNFACNMLQNHFVAGRPTIINMISIESGEGKSYISENFREYWEEKGLAVEIITYESDFDTESRRYLTAENFDVLYKPNAKFQPDVLLIEYPALRQSNVPKAFIQEADVNLFIVKSTRAWKDIDQTYLDEVSAQSLKAPLYLLINFAQKFAVEDFTGQLPPYNKIRKRVFELMNLGLTTDRSTSIE